MIGSLSLAGGLIPRQKKKISKGKIYDWLPSLAGGLIPRQKKKISKGKNI